MNALEKKGTGHDGDSLSSTCEISRYVKTIAYFQERSVMCLISKQIRTLLKSKEAPELIDAIRIIHTRALINELTEYLKLG